MIEFCHVTAGYHGLPVVRDVCLHIPGGGITALIGPNGCGKTTLLRAAVCQLPLQAGEILLDGRPVSGYGRRELARRVSFMPQVREVPSITVRGLVSHGRFPYLGLSRQMSRGDREAVERAMEDTAVACWADRNLRELSGGERQRVYLAMVLAQGTDAVFLDEPVTYLDLGSQFEVLELVRALNNRGKTIVMVLHDLGQALRYSNLVVLMDRGRLVLSAPPGEVFDSGKIDEVFGVRSCRIGEMYCFFPRNRGI